MMFLQNDTLMQNGHLQQSSQMLSKLTIPRAKTHTHTHIYINIYTYIYTHIQKTELTMLF